MGILNDNLRMTLWFEIPAFKNIIMKKNNFKTLAVFVGFALFSSSFVCAQNLFEGIVTSQSVTQQGGENKTVVYYKDGMSRFAVDDGYVLNRQEGSYNVKTTPFKAVLFYSAEYAKQKMGTIVVLDSAEVVDGHHCILVLCEINNMMRSTTWVDTSYRIPNPLSPTKFGLDVKSESVMVAIKSESHLVSVQEVSLPDSLFVLPDSNTYTYVNQETMRKSITKESLSRAMEYLNSEAEASAADKSIVEPLTDAVFHDKISHGISIVDFSAVWCGPCKKVYPIFCGLAEKYAGKIHAYSVDIDKCPATKAELNVLSVPVVVVFQDGKEVYRITGSYSNVGELIENQILKLLGQ